MGQSKSKSEIKGDEYKKSQKAAKAAMKSLGQWPLFRNGVAAFTDGTFYEIKKTGWKRRKDLEEKWKKKDSQTQPTNMGILNRR